MKEIKELGEELPGLKCDRSGVYNQMLTILHGILRLKTHVIKPWKSLSQPQI